MRNNWYRQILQLILDWYVYILFKQQQKNNNNKKKKK